MLCVSLVHCAQLCSALQFVFALSSMEVVVVVLLPLHPEAGASSTDLPTYCPRPALMANRWGLVDLSRAAFLRRIGRGQGISELEDPFCIGSLGADSNCELAEGSVMTHVLGQCLAWQTRRCCGTKQPY